MRERPGARSILLLLSLLSTPAAAADRPTAHAVASAHPLATAAGMAILVDGGNAFDAAVAVSAALAVVEPTGSGIGGGGFWLLEDPTRALSIFVDGREVAPLAAHPDLFLDEKGKVDAEKARHSVLAAGIPGAPAAWAHIAERYGSKPLAELLASAIRYARDGFAVDAKLAAAIVDKQARFSPEAARIFMPEGRPLRPGDSLRQPELARTLEALAKDGARGFYEGPVAQRLVAGVRLRGGIWSDADLRRYRVVEREPLVSWFRDYRIISAPPPSAGGIALAQVLQQLEVLGWRGHQDAAGKHLLIEAMRRAYRDRAEYLGDPDFIAIPRTRLSSRDHALRLARSIRPDRATASAALPAAVAAGTQTTHFSILDAEGRRVAATLSLNLSFGTGIIPPGTGVLLNNEMDDFSAAPGVPNAYGLVGSKANAIAPGKRMLSSMTPTIVEGPRGLLILGTPGGSRIISMVLLGILGFVNGLDAAQIVALPRYHHQYLPDLVFHESGAFAPGEAETLRSYGHRLRALSETYGNMQVVLWRPAQGQVQAASDPRGVGAGEVRDLAAPAAQVGMNRSGTAMRPTARPRRRAGPRRRAAASSARR